MTVPPTSGDAQSHGPHVETNANVHADAVVIGAGFGGLGAALTLAERGARVVVVEALTYPGGCASTFRRAGHRFESGATLCAGFAPGQLFRRWIDTHRLAVDVRRIDPVVEIRTPDLRLAVPADRARFVASLAALPGAPRDRLAAFFAEQAHVADTMWRLLDDPDLLPPLSAASVLRHLAAAPRYAALFGLAGRPLLDVVRRHGLETFAPLRRWLESFAQITVQCGVAEAEAPVALATADYAFRGAAHVHGGVGTLATALAGAVTALGGEVRFATRGASIRPTGSAWRVETNRGAVTAPVVIANVLPQSVRTLAGIAPGTDRAIDDLAAAVERGWGAVMLYLVVRAPDGASPDAVHLDLTDDPAQPYVEGNHVFLSISDADDAAPGLRTATVSTHVRAADLRALDDAARAAKIAAIQTRMRALIDRLAPEWTAGVVHSMTASPRTFERFTFRPGGLVGGVPRVAGLANYRGLAPTEVRDGLWLVGDSVFPGQSTLAAAIGGTRVAEAALRSGRMLEVAR